MFDLPVDPRRFVHVVSASHGYVRLVLDSRPEISVDGPNSPWIVDVLTGDIFASTVVTAVQERAANRRVAADWYDVRPREMIAIVRRTGIEYGHPLRSRREPDSNALEAESWRNILERVRKVAAFGLAVLFAAGTSELIAIVTRGSITDNLLPQAFVAIGVYFQLLRVLPDRFVFPLPSPGVELEENARVKSRKESASRWPRRHVPRRQLQARLSALYRWSWPVHERESHFGSGH